MMRPYKICVVVLLVLVYLEMRKMTGSSVEGMANSCSKQGDANCGNCTQTQASTRQAYLCPTVCCPDQTDVALHQAVSGVDPNAQAMCNSFMYQTPHPVDAVLYKGVIPPAN